MGMSRLHGLVAGNRLLGTRQRLVAVADVQESDANPQS